MSDEWDKAKLQAEVNTLRAELAAEREWKHANIELAEQLVTVTAERDALREALERIADTDPDEGTAWFHSVATNALNKGGGDGTPSDAG